jgi:hypothetical protein
MKRMISLLTLAGLALFVNCGGGSDATPQVAAPPPAKTLSYTDPTAASGEWKLVKDISSTGTHLVLNLVGPTDGTKYRGVGFTLQADPAQVKFVKFKDDQGNPTAYYKDGGIFLDKSPTGTEDVLTTLQAGGLRDGKLMVGIFQKSDNELWDTVTYYHPYIGAQARNCAAVVLQVAIDFDASLKAPAGEVPLKALKARVIPEHIGKGRPTRQMQDITLRVGSLKLQ